jgi:hypothetical protein
MVSGRASRPCVHRDAQPPARPQPRLTDASHSIAITGMFNAHHTRARLGCHQEPIRVAQCQLQVPRTTVR